MWRQDLAINAPEWPYNPMYHIRAWRLKYCGLFSFGVSCLLKLRLRAFEAAAAARGDTMADDGGDGATAGTQGGNLR